MDQMDDSDFAKCLQQHTHDADEYASTEKINDAWQNETVHVCVEGLYVLWSAMSQKQSHQFLDFVCRNEALSQVKKVHSTGLGKFWVIVGLAKKLYTHQ